MARINVEQKALTDPRFELLGQLLGSNRFEALGRMLLVWHECQERGSYVLPEKWLGIILGNPKGSEWLIECDLAERLETGIRIKGTEGRIEWLQEKRETGKQFGHLGAKHGKKGGRPKKGVETGSTGSENPLNRVSETPSPGFQNPPLALAPAPAPALSLSPAPTPPPAPPPEPCVGDDENEIIAIAPFAELVTAWNATELPGAGKIRRDPTRVGFWQQRLADEFWREHWREAVARAGKSDRCRGLAKGWSGLMVDTFLKDPSMLTRILEGEFDNPGANRPPPPPTVYTDPDNLPTNRIAPPMPKAGAA